MNLNSLQEKLHTTATPLIVEFWAPWCAPCRMMAPALDRLTEQYKGRVTVQKINADESAEILRSLRVMAIPTMLIFSGGHEIQRIVGAQSPQALADLFERLAQGDLEKPSTAVAGMDPVTRMLRLLSGLIIILIGIWTSQWIFALLGGLVMFWGWYDRCPVWQAVYPRIKAALKRSGTVPGQRQ